MEGSKGRSNKPKARQSIAHLPAKDNTTTDIAALQKHNTASNTNKRLRGKSLGPGGLEALTETSGNANLTAPIFHPKSILKPTVPLTPPKNIPTFDELKQRNTSQKRSPTKSDAEDLLIDFSTPGPSRDAVISLGKDGSSVLVDPFSPIHSKSPRSTKSARSQSTSGNAQEDGEQKQKEKQAILEQRAARRKSMANRRVSFAPEATLHTWSVMELAEDSTTSSASNSTRRQSAITSAQSPATSTNSLEGKSHPADRPSTPPEQKEKPLVKASPEHQRDLHQKKNRRSSDVSQASDEETFSSPGDDRESSPIRVEESIDSDSDSDSDGDTAMSIEDATSTTVQSAASSDTQTSLDERLRQAASQAGTRGIVYDENGSGDEGENEDESMELADGTVTHAFRQYARKDHQVPSKPSQQAIVDQENVDPKSRPQGSRRTDRVLKEHDDSGDEGMTMEMTHVMGGIVSKAANDRRKNVPNRRRSSVGRRRSSGDGSSYGDESMDLTNAKGGILGFESITDEEDDRSTASDGEMTMEFTNVVGGGLQRNNERRGSIHSFTTEDTDSMDMTVAAGGILEPIEEQTEPQTDAEDDRTSAMEMTRAVGRLLEPDRSKQELANGDTRSESAHETPGLPLATVASETGSPSLKPRLSGRRNGAGSRSTTPKAISAKASPSKNPKTTVQTTPSKQTPILPHSKTPERTPVATSVTHRGASPKKLFSEEIKARASPASVGKNTTKAQDLLFSQDVATGHHTPRVVLHAPKPHQHLRRRSSGIGIDNEGYGSPKVSEILSRRTSIGEGAPEFKLNTNQKGKIRFEDPRDMEREVDNDRADEHRRESGRYVMEREVDDRQEENTTLQLREMIESMTPKKDKTSRMKGRKSLAVGSAKGLLGKRPAELDDEQEHENESGTPKRLKMVSRESSPVKKIHLPRPPTKEETTGRLTRAEQRLLATVGHGNNTPVLNQSPVDKPVSPSQAGRFRDVSETASELKPASFENRLDNVVGAIDISTAHPAEAKAATDDEKITLQQFLNMTNIHFIELSTTKRRHTIALSMPDQIAADSQDPSAAIFVAAATTLPLIELYQHATRELKMYISEGRKVIRSIEAETLNEQPLLFKEYVEARPDVKTIMDNQFRNGKTHARLQSKAGWYAWRGQLVEGLLHGLEGIKTGMVSDQKVLDDQYEKLQQTASVVLNRKGVLEQESVSLQNKLEQIEGVDLETLKQTRQSLAQADQQFAEKMKMLQELEAQMRDKVDTLGQASELKTEMQDQIAEANRVREENRRWPAREVSALKAHVDQITEQSGWSLLTAEEDTDETNEYGVALTLTYLDQLKLYFYPSSFQAAADSQRRRSGRRSRSASGPNAPISLTYLSADDNSDSTKDIPTEKRFFLQLIRSQLQALSMMPKGSVSCQTILKTVSAGWNLAGQTAKEIQQLNTAGITRVSIQGDQLLAVQLMMMRPSRSRVDIDFMLSVAATTDDGFSTNSIVSAKSVYGPLVSFMDHAKMRKVEGALNKEVESKPLGSGSWLGAYRGFEEWLQAQALPKGKAPQKEQPSQQVNAVAEAPPPTKTELPRSPVTVKPSTLPSPVKRSPLAAKSANNRVQKKTLPVPTQRKLWQNDTVTTAPSQMQKDSLPAVTSQLQVPKMQEKEKEKENLMPVDVFGGAKPAITPEMQEAMMHTPVKRRVGALRRSPI